MTSVRLARGGLLRADAAVVFLVAGALRIGFVLASNGGPAGNFGYDAGVYYTAADALLHGRLPYADFVLLHPPGLMLVLTPFAALGTATTDHLGFMAANFAFEVLGAINAVLVLVVGRRLGLGRGPALLGAAFYAVWYGAINAEVSARLEPLGTVAFLVALVLLSSERRTGRRTLVLAGAALGFAASVKIWWIVPALVVLIWLARHRATRADAGPVAFGGALALVVVDGPFFAAAPLKMWRMVVTDQLGRHIGTSPWRRLDELTSLRTAFPHFHGIDHVLVLAVLTALTAGLCILGWRVERARMLVLVVVAQLLVLGVAPSYFSYYSGYPAAPLALLVSAAAYARTGSPGRLLGRTVAGVAVAAAATLTAIALVVRPVALATPFPARTLARGVEHVHCLMADSPMALIALNALTRNMNHQCPNWVDVSGRTYDVDAPAPGHSASRAANRKWQRDAKRYLLSGQAVILIRRTTGLDAATRRAIVQHPVLVRAGGMVVYRTGG